jgi:hypothetical protein
MAKEEEDNENCMYVGPTNRTNSNNIRASFHRDALRNIFLFTVSLSLQDLF